MLASTTSTYTEELRIAVDLARKAGAAILDFYEGPLNIEQKNEAEDREPVTQADLVANDLIVQALGRHFPDDGILAEESVDTARRLNKRRVWMVDPLDGTSGFIDGNGDFAVQIGLTEAEECVLGVVYQPVTGVLYRAVKNQGSWMERPNFRPEQLLVSRNSEIEAMRLAASRSHRSPRMDKVVKAFGFKQEVRRGSVGIKVGLIVEQQCDIYIHLSPRTKQWDTCAPEIILREAGGKITDLFGAPLRYNVPDVQNRNGLIASNNLVHKRIVTTLRPLLDQFGRVPV